MSNHLIVQVLAVIGPWLGLGIGWLAWGSRPKARRWKSGGSRTAAIPHGSGFVEIVVGEGGSGGGGGGWKP